MISDSSLALGFMDHVAAKVKPEPAGGGVIAKAGLSGTAQLISSLNSYPKQWAIKARITMSISRKGTYSRGILPLLLSRLTSLRVCAGAAPSLFVLGGCWCSCPLGNHLQVLSPTTRLSSRHQRIHVLRGGIAVAPSLGPVTFKLQDLALEVPELPGKL